MNMRFAFTKLSDYVRITMKTGYKKPLIYFFRTVGGTEGVLKKLRTAIALFLLFVTTCTFCINAYAENVPLLYINAGYGEENGVAEVELKIKNNKGISAYSVIVNYDPDMLTFIEASQSDTLSGGVFYCNGSYAQDAVRLVWSDSRNKSGDGTAAVLRFKAADGTADLNTLVSIGHTLVGDDLQPAAFEASDGELKISGEIFYGDVNRDGIVNVADIVALNMYLLDSDKNVLTNTSQANADVNGDKLINSNDSLTIMNYISMTIGGF